jgi:ligand-binding sensor domain-containing protein/signal transduction histidine kinase
MSSKLSLNKTPKMLIRKGSRPLWFGLRVLLLAVMLLSNTVGAARAQVGSIRFETLSVQDGLSQSTVRTIVQDDYGFMWFGTEDGLNKYDGYNFTLYKHDPDNAGTLSDSTITVLFQDSHGDLWVGTTNGLNRFARASETFEHFRYDRNQPGSLGGVSVSAIAEDNRGNLWVATTEGGLSRFRRSDSTFTRFRHDPDDRNSLTSNSVNALVADPQGGIWAGTSQGLDYYNPEKNRFIHYQNDLRNSNSLADNRVLALFFDRTGTLWVGTENGGLNRFRPSELDFVRYLHRPNNTFSLSSNYVGVIGEDSSGQMWVGGRNGLHQFHRENEYFSRYQHDPNNAQSLSNDHVLSIYADRSGVLWIGTFGGGLSIHVNTTARFTLYQHQPGAPEKSLSHDMVNALLEDRFETVWIGTMDGGLNHLDPRTGVFTVYKSNLVDSSSLSNNDVRALYEDRDGTLWVGTFGGGLNRFHRNTGRFNRYLHDVNNAKSLSDNRVLAIQEDSRGNLWIGTRGGGLELFDRSTNHFSHFRHDIEKPDSLISDHVRVIYESASGELWIGTDSGISVMDPVSQKFRHYANNRKDPFSLSDNRVLSISQTADGIIWVGTLQGGLNRYDPATQTFQHYSQKMGLPSDSVYGILADQSGYLWLSTSRGLSRFDPAAESFRNYDRRDGLQSYEFNPGAYFQNGSGKMYFGGVQGFNVFDPAKVLDNPVVPRIVITAFKKLNQTAMKDLLGGESITLSYLDNFVSFEFAALDYNSPEKNQYAYKLEGFDKDWIFAGNRRYTSYTNLRGGTYTFQVIGSNQDGVWNENGAKIEIVVVPPIWEQWWFLGSLAVLLVGGSFGGYRLRIKQVQAQNRQLEKIVHERTLEIERRREVAEGLRDILTILNSNRPLDESLSTIIRQIANLMNTDAVVIFRCAEEGCPVIVANNLPAGNGAWGEKGYPVLPAWIAMPILQGQVLVLPELSEKKLRAARNNPDVFAHFAALLGVPLAVNDKIDGGLVLLYKQARAFSEEDAQMAANFADHAAMAIANALLRSQAEEIAVSAERSRLARDLHDAVTQTLFATSLIAEVLPKIWERNPEVGRQKVAEIRELTRGALAEMRTLLMELRPTAMEDVPLSDLLQQLSEAFTGRARVPVALKAERSIELPSNIKIAYYRIAQEALNNIQKHARASQVEIQLSSLEGQFDLCIADNGIGFEPGKASSDHLGLGIMEERAASVGAAYRLESQPGQGTRILVSWQEP